MIILMYKIFNFFIFRFHSEGVDEIHKVLLTTWAIISFNLGIDINLLPKPSRPFTNAITVVTFSILLASVFTFQLTTTFVLDDPRYFILNAVFAVAICVIIKAIFAVVCQSEVRINTPNAENEKNTLSSNRRGCA